MWPLCLHISSLLIKFMHLFLFFLSLPSSQINLYLVLKAESCPNCGRFCPVESFLHRKGLLHRRNGMARLYVVLRYGQGNGSCTWFTACTYKRVLVESKACLFVQKLAAILGHCSASQEPEWFPKAGIFYRGYFSGFSIQIFKTAFIFATLEKFYLLCGRLWS